MIFFFFDDRLSRKLLLVGVVAIQMARLAFKNRGERDLSRQLTGWTFLLTFLVEEQSGETFTRRVAKNRERNCRVPTGFSDRHGLYTRIFTSFFFVLNNIQLNDGRVCSAHRRRVRGMAYYLFPLI